MQAKETKLQDLIEGTRQYIIPLFQRAYSWTSKEWDILWKDLLELCEADNPRTHFIGSIVNMPTVSVPEGVTKYLLIDGQQRLTTIFLLLIVLRDRAKELNKNDFAAEINNTLLVNPYKKDNDYYKLMPAHIDREIYENLINSKTNEKHSLLTNAYIFFDKKLRQVAFDYEKLKKIITNYLSVVSIVLDADDNPYLVFESLNAKGKPLTQADLIRNYFFMRIHVDRQDSVYNDFWKPMQEALNESLTEFIRHFLMRDGSIIKQNDVYYVLKEKITVNNAIEYLKELQKYSTYYQRLISPEFEPSKELNKYFFRLNRIEVTTAYPLLLNLYGDYGSNKLKEKEFASILKIIENFLIRRFVCNIPTNQLNKIFPSVYTLLQASYQDDKLNGIKLILQNKGYPKDIEFFSRFKETKFYGAGDRLVKTKLILETLEESYSHKELVPFKNLTIEHVMPQTLSEWWQNHLGEEWEETRELYLHTIGNLTLTAYNTEMSNDDYLAKRKIFSESHLELNSYFSNIHEWNKAQIELRADVLAKHALDIWSYFGNDSVNSNDLKDVKGTSPIALNILGQKFEVSTWRDVLEQTLNTIADLEPDKFDVLAQNFPRFLSKDKSKFRAIRQLQNGYFIEINQSAQSIKKFCNQAIETIELSSDDWDVVVA